MKKLLGVIFMVGGIGLAGLAVLGGFSLGSFGTVIVLGFLGLGVLYCR